MKNLLSADIATADARIVADVDGCIWVRQDLNSRDYQWSYVTTEDDGQLVFGYDARNSLPADYEPYLPLDGAAAALVMRGLKVDA